MGCVHKLLGVARTAASRGDPACASCIWPLMSWPTSRSHAPRLLLELSRFRSRFDAMASSRAPDRGVLAVAASCGRLSLLEHVRHDVEQLRDLRRSEAELVPEDRDQAC